MKGVLCGQGSRFHLGFQGLRAWALVVEIDAAELTCAMFSL